MKLKFNKGNWTGEMIEVDINENDNTFSLFGYDFTLKFSGGGLCRSY